MPEAKKKFSFIFTQKNENVDYGYTQPKKKEEPSGRFEEPKTEVARTFVDPEMPFNPQGRNLFDPEIFNEQNYLNQTTPEVKADAFATAKKYGAGEKVNQKLFKDRFVKKETPERYLENPGGIDLEQIEKAQAEPIVKTAPKTIIGEAGKVTGESVGAGVDELVKAAEDLAAGKVGKAAVGGVAGLIHTLMGGAMVPYTLGTNIARGFGGVPAQVAEGLDKTMMLPFDLAKAGSGAIEEGLTKIGLPPKEISKYLGMSMGPRGLLDAGVDPELDQKIADLTTEIGTLYAMKKAHTGAKKFVEEKVPVAQKLTGEAAVGVGPEKIPVQKPAKAPKVEQKAPLAEEIKPVEEIAKEIPTKVDRQEVIDLYKERYGEEAVQKIALNLTEEQAKAVVFGADQGKYPTEAEIQQILKKEVKSAIPEQETASVDVREPSQVSGEVVKENKLQEIAKESPKEEIKAELPIAEKVTERPLPQTETMKIEGKTKDILDEITDEKIGEKTYQSFEINLPQDARAIGKIEEGIASIVDIQAPKEAGEVVRGAKTYQKVFDELSKQNINTVDIKLQSADSRVALKKLVDEGVLENPRLEAGVSTDLHPTRFDINKEKLAESLTKTKEVDQSLGKIEETALESIQPEGEKNVIQEMQGREEKIADLPSVETVKEPVVEPVPAKTFKEKKFKKAVEPAAVTDEAFAKKRGWKLIKEGDTTLSGKSLSEHKGLYWKDTGGRVLIKSAEAIKSAAETNKTNKKVKIWSPEGLSKVESMIQEGKSLSEISSTMDTHDLITKPVIDALAKTKELLAKGVSKEEIAKEFKMSPEGANSLIETVSKNIEVKPPVEPKTFKEKKFKKPAETLEKQPEIAKTKEPTQVASKTETYGASNKMVNPERYAELKKKLGQSEKLYANPVIEAAVRTKNLAEAGLFHIEAGLREFEPWAKKMVAELGEAIKPSLPEAWRIANKKETLYHYSPEENLKGGAVKPSYQGRGQAGAELKNTQKGNLKTSAFFTKDSPYTEPHRFGNQYLYKTEIPAKDLFYLEKGQELPPMNQLKEFKGVVIDGQARLWEDTSVQKLGKSKVGKEDFNKMTGKDIERKLDVTSKEQLVNDLDNSQFAILTAENPDNVQMSTGANRLANRKLEEFLRKEGYSYKKLDGYYDRPEKSFYIPGMDAATAKEIGKKFKQESVVTQKGIEYQDNTIAPRKAEPVNFSGKQENYYSIMDINGEKVKFSIPVDFDNKVDVAGKPIKPAVETTVKPGESKRIVPENKYLEARTKVGKLKDTLTAGIDPSLFEDYAVIAGYHIENGVRNLKKFTEKMVEDLGENIKPHVKELWERGKKDYAEFLKKPIEQAQKELDVKLLESKQAPEVIAATRESMNELRRNKGLSELEKEAEQSISGTFDKVKEEIASGKRNPELLVKKILEAKKTNLEADEVLELNQELIRAENKVELTLERLEEAKKAGDSESQSFYQNLADRELKVLDETSRATAAATSNAGRLLRFAQVEAAKDYSIARLQQKAKAALKGGEIKPEAMKELESLSVEIKKVVEAVDKFKEKQPMKTIDDFIKNAMKEGKVESRRGIRTVNKEKLKAERSKLWVDLYKATSVAPSSIPLTPEAISIMKRLAVNYIQDGVITAEGLVDQIFTGFKEKVSKEDIIKALGTTEAKKQAKTDLQVDINNAFKEIRLLNSIERELTGVTEAKIKETKIVPKRIEELQGKLKSIKEAEAKRNADVEKYPDNPEWLLDNRNLKAQKTKTLKKIDEYKSAIQAGKYEKKVPKPVEMDQELVDLKLKERQLKKQVDLILYRIKQANMTKGEKVQDLGTQIANIPRALLTTADLSMPLRQGLPLGTAEPAIALQAFKDMHKAAVSDKFFDERMLKIEESPNARIYETMGIDFTGIGGDLVQMAKQEEAFIGSKLMSRVPGLKRITRFSEKGAITYLNALRQGVADKQIKLLLEKGMTPENSPAAYKSLGKVINWGTGRASLGPMERVPGIMNAIMFSPRNFVSRLQIMNPVNWAKLEPAARKLFIKQQLSTLATGMSMLALAKAAGADVEESPYSSDFGKIKVGNTRIDLWGGFQQNFVFLARFLGGKTKSISGKTYSLKGRKFPFTNRLDLTERMVRGKLSPQASLLVDWIAGKNMMGEEFGKDLQGEAGNRLIPLVWQDVIEAQKELGLGALGTGLLGFYGAGTQTFKPKPPKQR